MKTCDMGTAEEIPIQSFSCNLVGFANSLLKACLFCVFGGGLAESISSLGKNLPYFPRHVSPYTSTNFFVYCTNMYLLSYDDGVQQRKREQKQRKSVMVIQEEEDTRGLFSSIKVIDLKLMYIHDPAIFFSLYVFFCDQGSVLQNYVFYTWCIKVVGILHGIQLKFLYFWEAKKGFFFVYFSYGWSLFWRI